MRKCVRRVLCVALAALPMLGAADVASAAPVDLTCPATATIHFSPGVGLIPTTVTVTGTVALGTSASPFIACSSPLTGTPYTGGTGTATGTGTIGCVTVGLGGLVGSITATVLVTWDNGDTSTMVATVAAAPGPLPILTGTVTGGAMQGATGVGAPLLVTGFTGNCVLTPVTSFSLIGVAQFVKLS